MGQLEYRHAGVVLIRATTHDEELELPDWPDLADEREDRADRWCAWLRQVWELGEVREALQVASPVLSRQMRQVHDGHRPTARDARRMVTSVASYLQRWKGRPTPFGLFAGVAVAEVGAEPVARWGGVRRVVAHADADWLAEVITSLEECQGLLERLPVVVNTAAFVRGDRLVVPSQPQTGQPGSFAPLEVSVRCSRPVRAVLDAAQVPVLSGDLVEKLAADFPDTPHQHIAAMVGELVARRVLVSSLWPPMTAPDGLGHVVAQLTAVGADDVSAAAPLVRELRDIHDDLSQHTGALPAGQARSAVADRMTALSDVAPQPLVVDAALDCVVVVPEQVIGEAEAAAAVLLRLTPYPFGHPTWKAYHARFLERYGVGAVVPVGDLVQEGMGLGMPVGYLGSAAPVGRLTERDGTLLAWVQEAVMDGNDEIVLTEPMIGDLAVGDPAQMLAPPRAELAFRIHATSREALRAGAFQLVLTGIPRTASSMAGRFLPVLDGAGGDRVAAAYADLPTADPDAVAAQLSFPPRRRRSENVARTPQVLARMISLSEHRTPEAGLIPVDDLAVGADARQLYLLSRSTGQRIEPVVLHALEARVQTPPLARFLAEITGGRSAVYGEFDWGAAAHLPYLPRLRYGRVVLSPARWLLSARDLPATSTAMPQWREALVGWRRRWGVPADVVMVEHDLRLPLDLDQPLHRELLRSALNRGGHLQLREAPTRDDMGWCGRAHELLIPLRLAQAQAGPGRPAVPPRVVPRTAGHLPGRSPWLYARIHGHPDQQDDILTGHLPRLFAAWDDDDPVWWFRRYRNLTRPDAERHLRLYVRLLAPDRYGQAAARVAEWAADLREQGLVPDIELGTYHPETGCYGYGAAMAAAEEVFAADSAVALAQLQAAARTGTSPEALTAAGLVDLAVSFTGGLSEGMRWLLDQPQEQVVVDRALRDEAMRLADPRQGQAALRALPGGAEVLRAWQRRHATLRTYHERLVPGSDSSSVLRSLLHMHHVRMLGVDPERERVGRRLARAVALRQAARGQQGEQR